MEQQECAYHQLDFFSLLPGYAGGRALRALKEPDYFRELALNAAAARTKETRQVIASKAASARRRRLHTIPRTIQYIELDAVITERIVPWWPHQKKRQRRKRPVFVRIELSRDKLSDSRR